MWVLIANFVFVNEVVNPRVPDGTYRTYIEDVEDPDKVVPPNGDIFLIALRVEQPGCHIPFTLLDDLPLDLANSPAVETSVSKSPSVPVAS